jgi:ribokinase
MVLTQLEIPMPSIIRLTELCRRHHIPLILDPAPAQRIPAEVLPCVTWFTPNINGTDPGYLAEAFLHMGVQSVALKLGARGVLIAPGDGCPTLVSGIKVNTLDTTGAGDAFNGAFATALMRGMEPIEAARFACATAAISVTRRGAQPSMPTHEEVKLFLGGRCECSSGGVVRCGPASGDTWL